MGENEDQRLGNLEKMEADGADALLSMLVKCADMGAEMNITLVTGGAVVSGMLIGRRTYGEEAAKIFASIGSDTADLIGKAVNKMGKNAAAHMEDEPTHVHLKDAKIWHGSESLPGEGGVLWRGRLDKVNGFWLGTLGPKQ